MNWDEVMNVTIRDFLKKSLEEMGITCNINTGSSGDREHFSIMIAEKGNKKKIEKLISLGWRKIRRSKETTDNRFVLKSNKYEGYVFVVWMEICDITHYLDGL